MSSGPSPSSTRKPTLTSTSPVLKKLPRPWRLPSSNEAPPLSALPDTSPLQLIRQESALLANEVITAPAAPVAQGAPRLRRDLGRWDLPLVFFVAHFHLHVLPSISAHVGG